MMVPRQHEGAYGAFACPNRRGTIFRQILDNLFLHKTLLGKLRKVANFLYDFSGFREKKMPGLNHFVISAGLGSTLGPRVAIHHGQIGSAELAATLSAVRQPPRPYIDDLSSQYDMTRKYRKAVTRAYLMVRRDFSPDRVLADPQINSDFIKACHDLGIDDTVFHLNLALIGLRKHNKLKAKSVKSVVSDQWRVAVASEMAARAMYYRHNVSVDTTLAHPDLVAEFERIATSITPGFSSFQYRWAALNVRKKGANAKIKPKVIQELDWSNPLRFDATRNLPSDAGVYTLLERATCLFVAGTEDLRESIEGQQTIASARLFERDLWRPSPQHMSWKYVRLPDSNSDYRFGIVRLLVGQWEPIFNIPRGTHRTAA
jgi:hypothetical protein